MCYGIDIAILVGTISATVSAVVSGAVQVAIAVKQAKQKEDEYNLEVKVAQDKIDHNRQANAVAMNAAERAAAYKNRRQQISGLKTLATSQTAAGEKGVSGVSVRAQQREIRFQQATNQSATRQTLTDAAVATALNENVASTGFSNTMLAIPDSVSPGLGIGAAVVGTVGEVGGAYMAHEMNMKQFGTKK
jgi:hypothetical protein